MKAEDYPVTIVVNYNTHADTLACVDSLLAAGCPPQKLIVVDNCSALRDFFSLRKNLAAGVRLLRASANRGYAAGANLGLGVGLATGGEWLLVLNNDTLFDLRFFINLMHQAHPARYAMLGPLICLADEPDTIWFLSSRRVLKSLFTFMQFRNQSSRRAFPAVMDTGGLNGCAMLIHRSVFDRIGLFDEQYFMYGEEVDFCIRAERAGFRMGAVPSAVMWHKVSRSAGKQPLFTAYLRTANQVSLYRKYASGFHRAFLFLGSAVKLAWQILRSTLQGNNRLNVARWSGFIEGWFGVPERIPPGTNSSD